MLVGEWIILRYIEQSRPCSRHDQDGLDLVAVCLKSRCHRGEDFDWRIVQRWGLEEASSDRRYDRCNGRVRKLLCFQVCVELSLTPAYILEPAILFHQHHHPLPLPAPSLVTVLSHDL